MPRAVTSEIASSPTLKRAMAYRRLKSEHLTALMLGERYPLKHECERALRDLGHRVVTVPVGDTPGSTIRAALGAMVRSRPDFLLSINHFGFDEAGQLGAVLETLDLPVCVWYIDCPFFYLKGRPFPARSTSTLMLWEKALVEDAARAFGVDDVHHLPLATDPDLFAPSERAPSDPVAFVGDSMEHAREKWREMLPDALWGRAQILAEELGDKGRAHFRTVMNPARIETDDLTEAWDTLAAATWLATALYRRALMTAAAGVGLTIHGDPGWRRILPEARFAGQVVYGRPCAEVYTGTAVNLNATSLQMSTAVNQRVFDVPAAGGFLLSDDLEDLHRHFEVGREAVIYENQEHLVELIRYYRTHEAERRQVIRRARRRVLSCHTYRHRIARMLALLRARHG